MPPKWARLIEQYQTDGHVGLTPAFLVGALREPYGAPASADRSLCDLRALLESMRDDSASYGRVARVFECQNILQPVISLSNDRHGTAIALSGQPTKLYVWPWYPPERTVDFDWLLNAIWNHFRVPICDGRFSYQRESNTFTKFDERDRKLIEKVITNHDDDDG